MSRLTMCAALIALVPTAAPADGVYGGTAPGDARIELDGGL